MKLVPVSRETHHDKRLRPLSSFAHAAGMAATEVVMSEIGLITACYPMFFIKDGENTKLVALLGLTAGENLFVDGSGVWTGFYIPATIRCYPFMFGKTDKDGELAVLIDEDSGLLSDDEGEPMFGADEGTPDGPLARTINLMTQLSADAQRTSALAKQLNEFGLLKATALNITRKGAQQSLDGLTTIDEAAIAALSDEKFLELRRSGALTLAYAQVFSIGQLGRLQAKASLKDSGMDFTAYS